MTLPITGSPPTLTDTGTLSGGNSPTGSIVFTLIGPSGILFTETDTVSGDGTYTAGTALPTTGTVAGTYTWTARYSGDANNNAVNDQGGVSEQTLVGAASESLVTVAGPDITLGTAAPTLTDTADLTGGHSPAGTIVFTLSGPGGFAYSQTDTVVGNGIYTANTTLPTTGTVAGTYTWTADYSGDANNSAADDQGGSAEQTVVSPASPTLVTTSSPAFLVAGVTVKDTAVLSDGFSPTGTITFALTLSGVTAPVDTESVAVSGNGSYTTPTGFTVPTATGSYTWTAHYSGDANNNPANDQGGSAEQTIAGSPSSPTLTTTASPSTVTLGPAAPTVSDSAVLAGGLNPTGSIDFTLTGPAGFSYTQSDPVNGNGTYTASTTLTLPANGTVAGTYTWTAQYSGDRLNTSANDQGGTAEQTVVSSASPTLVLTAAPYMRVGTGPPTLSASAVLAGAYFPNGDTMAFTLVCGLAVMHQNDTVSGNGTYTATFTLPTDGSVSGLCSWQVVFGGDLNNNLETSAFQFTEVASNFPSLATTATPATVTLGAASPTLSDSALLSGGSNPTGTIDFTLSGPSGFSYSQSVPVNGDGTYTASTTLPSTGTVVGTYTWTATYSGDSNNNLASDQGGSAEQTAVSSASPTLTTTAGPTATLPAGPPGTVTLTDSAVLSGGVNPSGSIAFTLSGPGGFSSTQAATVSGNGSYSASTTLSTKGTVAGTYTWTAHYSGDGNNNQANDQGGTAEQTVVSRASPKLVTTASPRTVVVSFSTSVSDSAALSGGYFPTGSIVFTLTRPGGFSYTQTDMVNGDGTYTASTTETGPGTYTWKAHYGGDANNNTATDQGGAAEQTIVFAFPSLVTTASPNVTLGTAAPTLSDSAVLSGGLNPTGSILFTLTSPAGFSYSQTDPVTGNGTYTAGTTLPTTGTVAGTYTWTAEYSGDSANDPRDDQGGAAEQTVVSPAAPTLVTTASADVTLGTTSPTLRDSAVLSGGYFPTGTIVFTITGPGGFSSTETDTVSGNGTYTASATLPTTGTITGTYTWTAKYGDDANNNPANDQSGGTAEQTVVSRASPTLTTTAVPNTIPSPAPVAVLVTDTADLEGGYFPTGTIVFTLTGPAGFSYTQTDAVSGNGTYMAGTTLPAAGTVGGTYVWTARYGGDADNNLANDQGGLAEQVVVPSTLVTTASPNVSLPPGPPGTVTLSDSAALSGVDNPTGSIVFTLIGPGGFTYSQTDTVNGGGNYTASTTLPSTGTVAGTYTWTAHYSGDVNNRPASDQGGSAEQTVVSPAAPKLVTTASRPVRVGSAPAPTLTDSSVLSGGYFPTGSIDFTLTGPGGFVFTESDTVNGNGTYTATASLPTPGTVAGSYTWTARYSGDGNNNAANDQGGSAEQTTVALFFPTLLTTAGPGVTLDTASPTLSDSAALSGGFGPTGTITFTLSGPGGFTYSQTDTVTGNGTYTAGTALPATGTVAGTYTWTAHYSGDVNNNPATDQGGSAEQSVVSPASPTLVTGASPSTVTLPLAASTTLGDSAVLSGGYRPTGSIVFTLSGPGGFSFTETDTVGGNGTYAAGATLPATGTAAGTYTWTATYGGDPNDNPVTSSPEPVTIAQSTTTIHITPTPPSGPVGTSLSASATVSGDSPTGTVTFQLYPPSDPTCTGTPAFTSTEALSSGSATSGSDTAEIVGIWRWVVTYSGDTNYAGVRSGCQDAQVTITAAGATAPAAAVPGLPNTGAGAPGSGPSGHKPPALALLLLGALGLAGVAVGSITRRRRSRSGAPPADPERA